MLNRLFSCFLDVEKIEKIYKSLLLLDLNELSNDNYFFVTGAMDACMAIVGVDNRLTKVLNINDDFSKEQKIEILKDLLRDSEPSAVDFMEDYSGEEDADRSPLPEGVKEDKGD